MPTTEQPSQACAFTDETLGWANELVAVFRAAPCSVHESIGIAVKVVAKAYKVMYPALTPEQIGDMIRDLVVGDLKLETH